jgi:[ribosomal protein S18]-alanine N-acetyltransferase
MDSMVELHAGFRLRPMTEQDVEAVVAIENATQPTPWTARIFLDCFASHYDCRVMTHGEQVVGFAVLSSVLDELHLLNIAVAPAMQRRGIAWAALKQILADYQRTDMRSLYLEVRESNLGARSLYQHMGFQVIGERKNYYRTQGGRENAILMMKSLQP